MTTHNDKTPIAPPVAPITPQTTTHHGISLTDAYAGLRDPKYPEVTDKVILGYLKEENSYFKNYMADIKGLSDTIFNEIKGRIKEDDASVPQKDGDWLYHWAFEKQAQYRCWYRHPVASTDNDGADKGGAIELLLDEPAQAGKGDFYSVRGLEVSPDGKMLAWSEDKDGSERYKIYFKDIETQTVHDDILINTKGSIEWAEDGKSILYVELNENLRPFQVRHHILGNKQSDDAIVFTESDDAFFVGLGKSQSRQYLMINSADHVTSHCHIIPTHNPTAKPKPLTDRVIGHEYDVDHAVRNGPKGAEGTFVIRTNDTHKNFRIVTVKEDTSDKESCPDQDNWVELIAPSEKHYIRNVVAFSSYIVTEERHEGLDQIRLIDRNDNSTFIHFPEASYAAHIGNNPEADFTQLRLGYQSMVTPKTVYDYDPTTEKLTTLKTQEIPSGYTAAEYETKRLMAPARDGTLVPISLVYKKGFLNNDKEGPTNGPKGEKGGPLHLYGYGAYGIGMSPYFSVARMSLLDRGFSYAIAHIRGGDEMGYHWYEGGKLEDRTNAFHDFIDCAEYLAKEGYCSLGRISCSGGSAGGSLMGYVANHAPKTWAAIVAHVPFVDILNTMLDATLPLTPLEWPEWGNPITNKAAFDHIRSYCPYQNVSAQNYPPMLVTAGLNDPRVTYWEPAKWVAKLRVTKTDDNSLLLKTNMGAGHQGKSGRFDSLYESAEEYAFILKAFGKTS
jgi:oligopeptidase B